MKFRCDVTSDHKPCPWPATHFLVIPPGSRLYQGQDPSPRCNLHTEQARQVFLSNLATCELIAIESPEGKTLSGSAEPVEVEPSAVPEGEE